MPKIGHLIFRETCVSLYVGHIADIRFSAFLIHTRFEAHFNQIFSTLLQVLMV